MSVKRKWHKGPPPHVGWWESSVFRQIGVWRWWNGAYWSFPAKFDTSTELVLDRASVEGLGGCFVEWTTYYPENARVPRIDPCAL